KGTLEIKGWTDGAEPWIGLRGVLGMLIWNGSGFEESVRYPNLWPFDGQPVDSVCASFRSGLVALQQGQRFLVFQHDSHLNDLRLNEFCLAPTDSGVVAVANIRTWSVGDLLVSWLTYQPFDLQKPRLLINLPNLSEQHWAPWAVAATSSGSAVVLIVQ